MSKDELAKNILFKLREKQVKEFEIFGQRMYQELHNSFLSLQGKLIKNELENDDESFQVKDFYKEMFGENEKKSCECKEQINAQLQLIDTLKTRIEVLETDSVVKDEDIMKLQQETTDLREYIQSIYDNIDKTTRRNSFDGYKSYYKAHKRKEVYKNDRSYDLENSSTSQDIKSNNRFYDLENSSTSQDIKSNNRFHDLENSSTSQDIKSNTHFYDLENSSTSQDIKSNTHFYDLENSSASQDIKTRKTSTSSINNDDITPELTDQFNEQLAMDSYTDYYEEMFENNEIEENSFKEYSISALGNARIIDDLDSVQYPPHIKRPNPALNFNAEPGKFKYDRSFLMQFKGVCKEKPEDLPDTQVIGLQKPNGEKKDRKDDQSSHKSSPDQSQVTPAIELKFSPMTSEERSFLASSMNMRNETSSTTTSLPPEISTTGRRSRDRKKSKQEVSPPERSENRWGPVSPKATEVFIPIEIVQREVQALLNKLTFERFDSISDEIIEYANKSRDEKDGRILREVIRLIFEKSCEESNSCAMYAQLCRRMMERLDPEIVDENVKNTEGKIVQGGTLFRKYLLNRCQETFEKGWKPSNEKRETALTFNEAVKAKRQGLGLIRFISELFKVNMITERIMHECIKRLMTGSIEEEEMSSLCAIMNTVGKQLDHDQPNHLMDSYFARMEEILRLPNLSSRIKSMIKDVIDLRNTSWNSPNAPKTIVQSKDDGWSTVGEGSKKIKDKVGDLSKFGSVNRSKISGNVSLAPGGILGSLSGGAKGWNKSDNKEKNSNMFSVLTKRKI